MVQPANTLDPYIYFPNGSSIDTNTNILTMPDGSQIDTTTGLKYVDPADLSISAAAPISTPRPTSSRWPTARRSTPSPASR